MSDARGIRRRPGPVWLALVVVALAGAGCAKGPPPTLYLLDSTQGTQLPGFERGVAVGVGPIELPTYLDRPHVVTRRTGNRLGISESHQWAEPLKAGVSRELIVTLALRLDTNRVYVLPQRQRKPLDYRVTVDIARFDGTTSGRVVLAARWVLFDGDGDQTLVTKVSEITVPVDGEGYEVMVRAMSEALSVLSGEIAEDIQRRIAH